MTEQVQEQKVVLEFTVEEANALLGLLGKLPYADVAGLIGYIIQVGGPQADAIVAARKQAEEAATPAAE